MERADLGVEVARRKAFAAGYLEVLNGCVDFIIRLPDASAGSLAALLKAPLDALVLRWTPDEHVSSEEAWRRTGYRAAVDALRDASNNATTAERLLREHYENRVIAWVCETPATGLAVPTMPPRFGS